MDRAYGVYGAGKMSNCSRASLVDFLSAVTELQWDASVWT